MRCKTLTAIYKNEINTLKKLYEIDFLIHKSVRIHIEQFTVRKIEIDFTSEQLVDDLIAVLTKVERLLMLFDGYFMNLISIEFQDSAGCVPPNLKECAEHFMRRRLAYFHSNKILFSSNYLLDFSKVLTPALYEKWKGILEDLDVAHQVYLYSLCDTNQPVDLRCAFLIELAEPVVEIVKANSPLFESLNPGKQGASLRDCLRALITTYGSDIFENEINSCFETFLKTSVYKGYKQDKIEMRGDRAEMSDFPLYLNTVAGGLDRRDQTIGGFSFVVKIYAVPVVEIIG